MDLSAKLRHERIGGSERLGEAHAELRFALLARRHVGFEDGDLRIAPFDGGAQVHDVAIESFAALLALRQQRHLVGKHRGVRCLVFLERSDAIRAREQLVLERRHVRALYAETLLRGVQRLQVRGQLLAQLCGFGVGARDRDSPFRIGDARALVEFLDATFGGS